MTAGPLDGRPAPAGDDAHRTPLPVGTRTLPDDTLVVFLSDTHIGGDPDLSIFEATDELVSMLVELAERAGPVELVLAGDFFDLLLIGDVPEGANRVSQTVARTEYGPLFGALRRLAAGDRHRVTYLPGNHDAEVWWNEGVQRTLLEGGLVDAFELSYQAVFESAPDGVVYGEHGNAFDPPNAVTDYRDPLDTPLGDHIVTDVVRRVAPAERLSRNLDLRDIGRVFPLTTIPEWMAGRVFYDLLGRLARGVLLPLIVGYSAYRVAAYAFAVASGGGNALDFWDSHRLLPQGQAVFGEIAWDAALFALVLVLFFVTVRRAVSRTVLSMAPHSPGRLPNATDPDRPGPDRPDPDRDGEPPPLRAVRALLTSDRCPPMRRGLRGRDVAVFVSGHTHAPALSRLPRDDGRDAVVANSGCWLRQLRPVPAHFGGPPVFVSRFVLTHVRVFYDGAGVHVELWEHPKPAQSRLPTTERVASFGRHPPQPRPGSVPRVVAHETLTVGRPPRSGSPSGRRADPPVR